MKIRALHATSLLLTSALFCAGCKSKPSPEASPAATPAPTAAVPVNPDAGSISGTVHLNGTPPARVKIDMSMDPACSMMPGDNYSEQIVADHGALANVYIYVKAGANPSQAPADTSPVVMDQHGCRYVPHVIAIQQGTSVEFHNSDPTMHNVHTVPTVSGNPVVDVSQGPGAGPQTRRFDHPDTMLTVGCNNHPWMRAYINVADTPYFALTKPDGAFQITGLPPGKYTLAAVHEKLGEQDQDIVIPARGAANITFQFKLP